MSADDSFRSSFQRASVPGASVAVIRDGSVAVNVFGVKEIDTDNAVTVGTIFDAASLSKPIVAYAVLQLVEAGILDLDRLVSEYLPSGIAVAESIKGSPITIRHILTHSSGLPNLREGKPLRTYFSPGEFYSYSSLGFTYLQYAIEAATGDPLETVVSRWVFQPLEMLASSFEWQPRFAADFALPHNGRTRLDKHYPPAANASYSLHTTAKDYAAFVAATIAGIGLSQEAHTEWLTPSMRVRASTPENLNNAIAEQDPRIAWGLGWGIELPDCSFFQWGKMDGLRTFALGSVKQNCGVVVLTNSNMGLRVVRDILHREVPGGHPCVSWVLGSVTE